MRGIVDPAGRVVADIGCGGGIYSRAWREMGAARVVGVDLSERMVADARETSGGDPALSFVHADAASTELAPASVDIVFSRALIHHLTNIAPMVSEARRILRPGGIVILQDRTIEDVQHPPSPEHLRGWFFERFPRLLDVERGRRPASDDVVAVLEGAGFAEVSRTQLGEPRRRYRTTAELAADLRARTGRSILHELDDAALDALIAHITDRVEGHMPLVEIDYWTIWSGVRA